MSVVFGILMIGIIIAIHEFGHFLAAKLFKIGVMEFSIGMGPLVYGKRIGETVYTLRALPLGGFCAMHGEPSIEANVENKDGEEKKGRGPEHKSDWEPGRGFLERPKWQQIAVALAGPGMNMLTAFLMAVALASFPNVNLGPGKVTDLGPVDVAEKAGIEVGDVVLSINDTSIPMAQAWSTYMATHPEAKEDGYSLKVFRPSDGKDHEFFVVPEKESGLIGITYQGTPLEENWMSPFVGGWKIFDNNVKLAIGSVKMLFTGRAKASDVSGIIGITVAVGDTVDEAASMQEEGSEEGSENAVVVAILSLAMMISVSLAVMNMLPLPALDGGRSLMALGEWITGKRLPAKVAYGINSACMMVLFVLMGFIMLADLVRLFGRM